ncbi:MAG: UMP kinase [Spirochaetia bacterium]
MKTWVLSVGGSIIAPEGADSKFIAGFYSLIKSYIEKDNRFIIVTGGGAVARDYQNALRKIISITGSSHTDEGDQSAELDWIGIAATRLNARLMKAVFHEYCREEVVTDPTVPTNFAGSVLVAAGWKPGFSTDYDAVILAESFGADTVINLSNIKQVYSADPKQDPEAVPLDSLTWEDFRELSGGDWTPGKNSPFDPVAAGKAADSGLKVIVADGRDLENLRAIFAGKPYTGTLIGSDPD